MSETLRKKPRMRFPAPILPADPESMLTVQEAARIMRVTDRNVLSWLLDRKLECRIPAGELRDFIERSKRTA